MGSMITLGVGRMEIDWGKNHSFTDYSVLFQPSDIKQIPYYYVDTDTDKPIIEMKEGYARELSKIRKRLDLLGYDMDSIRRRYESAVKEHEEYGFKILLTFESYFNAMKTINIPETNTIVFEVEGYDNGYDFGEYVSKCVLKIPQIKEKILVQYQGNVPDWVNPTYDLSMFLENLDPYITLRILSENPNNANFEVQWNFADVIDGGWVNREDIVKGLSSNNKVLVVTEG